MDGSVRQVRVAAVPLAVSALTAVAEIAAVVLSWGLEAWTDTALYALYSLALAVAGMLVASRHPRNAVGWLMLWLAVSNAVLADLAQGYGLRALAHGWPGGSLGELVASTSVVAQMAPMFVLWLVFPTGRLLRRAWLVAAVMGGVASVLVVSAYSFSERGNPDFVGRANPYVVDWLPATLLWVVGNVLLAAVLVGSATSVVVRFRRSDRVERQQLKLFAFAAMVAVVVLPLGPFLWDRYPAARAVVAIVLLAQPLAVGMAMFRYRLYDIDRVISRTISYGVVTAVVVVVYAGTVVALGALAGQRSAWATAGATLAAAAAFRPVRARAQTLIDRRFDHARYDALARIVRFIDDLRAGRAAPEQVETVLREVTGDPELTIHHRPHGARPDGAREDGDVAAGVPVRRGGALVATVTGTSALRDRPSLLREAVAAAGLAIEIAGLRGELRRRLDEVEASRARLVEVADQERLRLERDLHDGAQQRLVSIGLALRHAQHQLHTGSGSGASRTIDDAVAEIAVAIDELRELAHGLPPSSLEAGLSHALRELAERAPLPVSVETTTERFTPAAETTAYFVACEALTNAVKHAHASHVAVGTSRDNDALVVRISDDGIGGATPNRGSGLRGMTDRLAALGGTLTIDSAHTGTTITAAIPCAS